MPNRGWRSVIVAMVAIVNGWEALTDAAQPNPFAFYHDDVLGTALEVVVEATDAGVAAHAEAAVLGEIDRLAGIVSTYDPSSEVSRWIAARQAREVSADLAAILRRCDRWREASAGVFHPGVAVATTLWRNAERAGAAPDERALESAAAALREPPWTWAGRTVAPRAAAITLDALAKGAIVDAACEAALELAGVRGVLVNVGGDIAVRGAMERHIVVGAPKGSEVGAGVLDRVVVGDGAIATSGVAFRGFDVAGRRHSHLIDPRTARPADAARSATVVADSAADADALATICCVLTVAESLALVERWAGASCLIVDRDGLVHASQGWHGERFGSRRTPATQAAFGDAERRPAGDPAFALELDLEINRPAGGGRYRRPYVAAWVEDQDGFPVKTLLLWVQRDGNRWVPDLKRWYRADRLRRVAEETDLIATISEATRHPGRHSVSWDGRDNAGATLPAGEYTICLEAAREHGTYQFDRRTVRLGDRAFHVSFDGGTEIKSATLHCRPVEDGR